MNNQQCILSELKDGTFFTLKNSKNIYFKLYNVIAKDSTLCFNFDTKSVKKLDMNKIVIPIRIDISKLIWENCQ